MFRTWIASAFVLVLAAPAAVGAQPADRMSATEIALACAPPPRLAPSTPTTLRLAGSQDVAARSIFGPGDTLVVTGGTGAGVSVGQRYFVRRGAGATGMTSGKYATMQRGTETLGWIRIVSVNDTTALAIVEHACDVLTAGDSLEPYVAPVGPASRSGALAALDFSSPGHIVFGDSERSSVAIGEYAIIDRGTKAGATVGSRFAVYRDLRTTDLPLTSVGEAVVVSESDDAAVVRIVRARDAVFAGDLLIPEKKD